MTKLLGAGSLLCWAAWAFSQPASGEPLRPQSSANAASQSLAEMDAAGVRMAFDVASVKPDLSDVEPASRFALGPGDGYLPGGIFSAINQPLIAYVRFAYKLGQSDLLGLPAWIYSDRFDIDARSGANPTKDQMRLMMQALLTDRFKMRTHTESRTRPVLDLILSKRGRTGPQMRPHAKDDSCVADGPGSAIPCGSVGPAPASVGGHGRLVGRGVTVARLAGVLTNPFTGVDRPVFDRTGLAGTFDFDVEWSLSPDETPARGSQVEDTAPTFLQALQDQLGLKLKSAQGRVEVRVIDHIERPSAN